MLCSYCNRKIKDIYHWKVGRWVFHDFRCCRGFVETLKNVPRASK